MGKKYVYMFNEGAASMRNLLGGKGANLAEMTNMGLPVPYGFTVSTEACTEYNEGGHELNAEMKEQIEAALAKLEEIAGKKLGADDNPLLVSVRSGARASMPGMMDTVLNLGLNDVSVKGLAKATNNERFAYDSYRRFVMMFADVVIGVAKSKFERHLDEYKEKIGAKYDVDLSAEDMKVIAEDFKKIYLEDQGKPFPQDPKEQLFEAVKAVFHSWDNPRAFTYRRMNDIPYSWGTAVNVQMMV
ncbi:MAG: pyruvate, phosphate dikinase, partial [Firmicutes bacterium]|nr:pyruvate, phosphate dikinase [Bacillota bacterium]